MTGVQTCALPIFLCQPFHVLVILIAQVLEHQMAYFISWTKEFCNIANVTWTVFFFGWSFTYTVCCCYCDQRDQLYKKYTENKCYAIAYIYICIYLNDPNALLKKKKKKWPRCILVAIGRWRLGGRHVL